MAIFMDGNFPRKGCNKHQRPGFSIFQLQVAKSTGNLMPDTSKSIDPINEIARLVRVAGPAPPMYAGMRRVCVKWTDMAMAAERSCLNSPLIY